MGGREADGRGLGRNEQRKIKIYRKGKEPSVVVHVPNRALRR